MNTYPIGTTIILSVEFRDTKTDELVDPGAVTCAVQDAQGQTTAPTVERDGEGAYSATYVITLEGIHFYRFEGTDPAKGASPDREFEGQSTVFLP